MRSTMNMSGMKPAIQFCPKKWLVIQIVGIVWGICILNYISNCVEIIWNCLIQTWFLVFRSEARYSWTISSPCSNCDDRRVSLVTNIAVQSWKITNITLSEQFQNPIERYKLEIPNKQIHDCSLSCTCTVKPVQAELTVYHCFCKTFNLTVK